MQRPCSYFSLIMAPTRELAAQVQTQFDALGKIIGLKTVLLVGGIPISQQTDSMRFSPPHVVIATPGRFVDHLKKTKGFDELRFADLKFLVIDEADRMLGSDFESVIDKILCILPHNRQTLLFSATMTEKVGKLQRASINDPIFISTRKSKFQTMCNLKQLVHLVPQDELDTYLVYLLRVALCPEYKAVGLDQICLKNSSECIKDDTQPFMASSVIVFTRTKAASNRINLLLRQFLPQPVIALNGDMPQAQRLGALHKFKQTQCAVLVATDVASRGLDIPQVGLVINYDVPLDAKTYMHRIGRTARAGRHGCALTLLTQYSVIFFLKEIESHLIATTGKGQERIPALVEPGSEADKVMEKAVEELNVEVKEASVRATKAVECISKRLKSGKRSNDKLFTKVGDASAIVIHKESMNPVGLKQTAWASEAPLSKKNEILQVMSAVNLGQRDPNKPIPGLVEDNPHFKSGKYRKRKFKNNNRVGKFASNKGKPNKKFKR